VDLYLFDFAEGNIVVTNQVVVVFVGGNIGFVVVTNQIVVVFVAGNLGFVREVNETKAYLVAGQFVERLVEGIGTVVGKSVRKTEFFCALGINQATPVLW